MPHSSVVVFSPNSSVHMHFVQAENDAVGQELQKQLEAAGEHSDIQGDLKNNPVANNDFFLSFSSYIS